jgi:hypothetical protein
MEYITNINFVLDKSLIDLVEEYYYSYEINIPPIKLNPLFNSPLLSYIHKPLKDCSVTELCYSGDKHNIIYHILSKYQIDINTKNNSFPINIASKFVYDSYKNDINKFLIDNPCTYYTFIYENFINNPKVNMNNLKFYILNSKCKYIEDKCKYMNDKIKSIDNRLIIIEDNIKKIFYMLLSLFIYNSVIFIWIIK